MTDHAQRATELAGDCKTTDPRSVQWIMKELEDAYATGRLEGLEEAAAVAEGRAQRARPDSEIRTAYLLRRDEAERVALMIRAKTNER